MSQGIVLAEYYLREALRLIDASNVSAEINRAEALRRWLLESWQHPEITFSEVLQYAPVKALRESPAAESAIGILEKHGWLNRQKAGTLVRGKKRKRAFVIVRSGNKV